MRSIPELLDEIQRRAVREEEIRLRLLATKNQKEPVKEFCKICRDLGYEIYPMELIGAGEEFYAQMKRSTNGGGENSPVLEGEDDFYEMFLVSLERPCQAET